jgi:mono/diheme cytochrome c family protein
MKRSCVLLSLTAMIGLLSGLDGHGQLAPPRQPPMVRPIQAPQPLPASQPPVMPQAPLETFLAFDAESKDLSVTNGTPEGHFTFNVTNISADDVTINFVKGSCQCTVATLPSQPWKLAPKESGQFSATMQLAGTPPGGSKTKTLTVNSDKGVKVLYVKTTVMPAAAGMTEADRNGNQKMAMADRQAVFKGDCVKCHAQPAKDTGGNDKMGKDLFASVCGVCHESEHQASFVPNLHHLPEPTNSDFWKNWIMHGKPGSLMPAFAKQEGGILTDVQIESLVKYLSETIPSHPVAAPVPVRADVK